MFWHIPAGVEKQIDKNKSSILETSHNRDIGHCCKFHCFGSEGHFTVMQFQLQIFWFSLTKMHHVRPFKVSNIVVPWFHLSFSRDATYDALQRSQSVDGFLLVAASSPDLLHSCLPLIRMHTKCWMHIAGCILV